jgi:hypothetical protein
MKAASVVQELNGVLAAITPPVLHRFSRDLNPNINAGYPILMWQADLVPPVQGGDQSDEEDAGGDEEDEGDGEEEEQNQGGVSQVTVPSVTCTVGADPGGSITTSYNSGPQQTVVHIPVEDASGARLQITVTPDPGYLLKDILVNGVKLNGVPTTPTSGSVTFTYPLSGAGIIDGTHVQAAFARNVVSQT